MRLAEWTKVKSKCCKYNAHSNLKMLKDLIVNFCWVVSLFHVTIFAQLPTFLNLLLVNSVGTILLWPKSSLSLILTVILNRINLSWHRLKRISSTAKGQIYLLFWRQTWQLYFFCCFFGNNLWFQSELDRRVLSLRKSLTYKKYVIYLRFLFLINHFMKWWW